MVARVLLGRALRPYLDSVDLVQSVHRSLMIALRTRDYDLENPEQLVALAITMVRRKTARHWRRMQRQKRMDGASDSQNLAVVMASLCDSREDPAEEAQFTDLIERLCDELDETERRMLDLRLQGYTSPEVAAELGMHAVAIRVRWTRLRKRLQERGVVADWM